MSKPTRAALSLTQLRLAILLGVTAVLGASWIATCGEIGRASCRERVYVLV